MALFFTSCQEERVIETEQLNLQQSLENDAKTINALLAELKLKLIFQSKQLSELERISFEIVKNKSTNEITVEKMETFRFFPMADKSEYYSQTRGGGYQVDCDLGGNGDWTESCSGTYSCGRLIARCLDEGGCATTCQQQMAEGIEFASVLIIYVPEMN